MSMILWMNSELIVVIPAIKRLFRVAVPVFCTNSYTVFQGQTPGCLLRLGHVRSLKLNLRTLAGAFSTEAHSHAISYNIHNIYIYIYIHNIDKYIV